MKLAFLRPGTVLHTYSCCFQVLSIGQDCKSWYWYCPIFILFLNESEQIGRVNDSTIHSIVFNKLCFLRKQWSAERNKYCCQQVAVLILSRSPNNLAKHPSLNGDVSILNYLFSVRSKLDIDVYGQITPSINGFLILQLDRYAKLTVMTLRDSINILGWTNCHKCIKNGSRCLILHRSFRIMCRTSQPRLHFLCCITDEYLILKLFTFFMTGLFHIYEQC